MSDEIKKKRKKKKKKNVNTANNRKTAGVRTKEKKTVKKQRIAAASLKDRISLPKIRIPQISFTKRGVKKLIILIAVIMLVVTGTTFFVEKYRVTDIIVEGSTHYSVEEITDMVVGEGFLSRNSVVLSLRYRNKEIKDVPFIETMSVRTLSPNTIKITVYEKAIAGFVEYLGQFIYFDKDGTVIESSDIKTQGIPQVVGMEFDHVVLYEKLPVEDDRIFKEILDVAQLLDKYEISVDKIYFDKDYNLTLYFDKARVKLGNFDNIDEKIIRLKAILPELEGKKGVLRMENYTPDTDITTFELDE